MANYICYESGYRGVYTLPQMQKLYEDCVNANEYPDFDGWLWDMVRSGVFEKVNL